ncbi:growth arrest and DNA damage-inducible proteins-interacting protein CRIF [Nomia melanderi]|uniref:growth arrest and DNA damage-inducible proteins-interacting protein CRIF n=1 Tax=Nomia melanderi TaxID=2448451 RepID=UPI0013044499|nr:uncharacterized protein LOC116426023 [Nomia melanderi]XP_031830317.1 uncharacterized protein LOC116426023 [Nomia melanderi]XP_031830319.1 uncharacterized protein LOC116426023 [Nomia melanderi]XP_031830320.1 uncharacterized protein LOC116426023 [Nomia melanderi]XP_031830321.1 uncharacterized protein LOC116426023 [Nomia melanderi]
MSLRNLVAKMQLTVKFQHINGRRYLASKAISNVLDSVEEEPLYAKNDSEDIEQKRNKSRLNPGHRNILHGRKPYDEPLTWFHNTLKYKRKILGKYGIEALGVSAGLAWPTPKELDDAVEYERVAFPMTLQERWQKIKEEKKKKEDEIIARQDYIAAKMSTMNDLITSVQEKIAKKEAEAEAARKRKEIRLIEIRKKLMAKGAMTQENVEEMFLKYEKEDKKKRKEAKKQRYIEREYIMKSKAAEAKEKNAVETREGSPATEKSME